MTDFSIESATPIERKIQTMRSLEAALSEELTFLVQHTPPDEVIFWDEMCAIAPDVNQRFKTTFADKRSPINIQLRRSVIKYEAPPGRGRLAYTEPQEPLPRNMRDSVWDIVFHPASRTRHMFPCVLVHELAHTGDPDIFPIGWDLGRAEAFAMVAELYWTREHYGAYPGARIEAISRALPSIKNFCYYGPYGDFAEQLVRHRMVLTR